MLRERLTRLLREREVSGLFQTVVNLQDAKIYGYEGLIRGPSDSPIHSPIHLFNCAREHGMLLETERLCRDVLGEQFFKLGLSGKLFINVSPHLITGTIDEIERVANAVATAGLAPSNIVIELTESSPSIDYVGLRAALQRYRDLGYQVAIDDLGEGFSNMRMWSEIRPDFIKIDMHFIQGINLDPLKQQFVRSIKEIAEKSGAAVIAEGIETHSELAFVAKAGIEYGQGYFIARPVARPLARLPAEVADFLLQLRSKKLVTMGNHCLPASAEKLSRKIAAVSSGMTCNEIYDLFTTATELEVVPVVENGLPLGLITKSTVLGSFAKPYQRELHGKKSCAYLMSENVLIVDKSTSLQNLSQLVADGDKQHLINGFVITSDGKYLGMGNGQDLMREITQLQINAAKLANPLTQLPGNVLINERIDYLLSLGTRFHACYADLDFFKPYNDVYGYQKGDDIIQLCGEIIVRYCSDDGDFVGHIGGDDFIILFKGDDYEQKCRNVLSLFEQSIKRHFRNEHVKAGGYYSEDRKGNDSFHMLVSLSLGVVPIDPDRFSSRHDVAAAMASAKKEAKKISGNSYFLEPRRS
ncbi:diguanylate cyclase (GGDEF)-like protein [Oxalobacteraceae bacterium GrIS 2.11]